MDYINDLYELRDMLADEAHIAKEKIKAAGGMSGGDYDIVDKITHTMKSLDCCIEKAEEGDNSSMRDGMGGRDNMSRRGYPRYSMARGRMNAPRDSRGRYSGADGDVEGIKRDVMELAEKVKMM